MNNDFELLLRGIAKTGRDMWDRGWAEANGGNISLRLDAGQHALLDGMQPQGGWVALQAAVADLGSARFAVTGTGRYLRNIELFPERNLGFIELDPSGAAYRILWGFQPEGGPTSEISAHLLSHAAIKRGTDGYAHAVIHTHTPALIALTYLHPDLDTARLSSLLWRMHAECVVVFPRGIEFIPWLMAGSDALGRATAQALEGRTLAVWEHHGIVGTGRNLDEAFGRIYVAEKSAAIYMSCMSAGGIRKSFSNDQLRTIAVNFKCALDESLLRDG